MTVASSKTLDLRALEPQAPETAVLESLASLPLGTTLQIIAARAPSAVLAALQREYPSDFDWGVLQDGPPLWRVEITLRAGEPYHGVQDLLGEDHRRLDARFEAMLQAAQRGPDACRGEALDRFLEFRTGLQHHIRAEEEVLFQVFEQRTGVVGGAVHVMSEEHREIEGLLERMAERLAAGLPPDELGRELRDLLGPHHAKEEEVLYVMTDRHLDASERAALIRRLQQT